MSPNTTPKYVARNHNKLPSPLEKIVLKASLTNAVVGNFESEQSDLVNLFQEEEEDIASESHIWSMWYKGVVEQDTMGNKSSGDESHFDKVLVK